MNRSQFTRMYHIHNVLKRTLLSKPPCEQLHLLQRILVYFWPGRNILIYLGTCEYKAESQIYKVCYNLIIFLETMPSQSGAEGHVWLGGPQWAESLNWTWVLLLWPLEPCSDGFAPHDWGLGTHWLCSQVQQTRGKFNSVAKMISTVIVCFVFWLSLFHV